MSGDRLDQLDYYDLLQVPEHASGDELRRAFHAFAAKYHPDRFVGAPQEKHDRAATIYRRGAEAYRVLGDPAQRALYDAQRARGKLRFDAEEAVARTKSPPAGPLTVRSPKARPFVQKALDAIKREDWATARLNLKLALQHEPGNASIDDKLREVESRARTK